MIFSIIPIILSLIFPFEDINQESALTITSVKAEAVWANKYTFSVGIQSPDKGCEQFADWWEIVTTDGILLYRRVLLHSHVKEQPFIRSGGPVVIDENQTVIIRGHMNTSGYSTSAYQGSVKGGFKPKTLPANFYMNLAKQEPLPKGCAF